MIGLAPVGPAPTFVVHELQPLGKDNQPNRNTASLGDRRKQTVIQASPYYIQQKVLVSRPTQTSSPDRTIHNATTSRISNCFTSHTLLHTSRPLKFPSHIRSSSTLLSLPQQSVPKLSVDFFCPCEGCHARPGEPLQAAFQVGGGEAKFCCCRAHRGRVPRTCR